MAASISTVFIKHMYASHALRAAFCALLRMIMRALRVCARLSRTALHQRCWRINVETAEYIVASWADEQVW